ncbi:hypothetical protein LHFGNBLO_006578 (plasmid) [Mesorhizobium sp. AR10]|uniref:hypothetical protein n=1 Tax=Mesorhizobium sp. AR10 TaxID=2865839 RepID=UPI00215E06EA|nr:hypothetical protein [Mesorhizobium sp. AR10]UVK35715.1 hypothetical protein LHFGNBLO_006578 [Mesorhizobium sp. AR10]
MREFRRAWPKLKGKIGKETRVEAAVHSKVIAEMKADVEAIDSAEDAPTTADAQIAALKKIKDAVAVQKVAAEFDGSEWGAT